MIEFVSNNGVITNNEEPSSTFSYDKSDGIINAGTISSSSATGMFITDYAQGISIDSTGGTITNSGTISASSATGSITNTVTSPPSIESSFGGAFMSFSKMGFGTSGCYSGCYSSCYDLGFKNAYQIWALRTGNVTLNEALKFDNLHQVLALQTGKATAVQALKFVDKSALFVLLASNTTAEEALDFKSWVKSDILKEYAINATADMLAKVVNLIHPIADAISADSPIDLVGADNTTEIPA